MEAAPEQDTICIICMDPVGDKKSYSTMVCPACKHAWFHRACIQVEALHSPCMRGSTQHHQALLTFTLHVFLLQGQATCAGINCFQCPLCRDKDKFKSEMFIMGIRIPDRLVSCRLLRYQGTRAVLVQGDHPRKPGPLLPVSVSLIFMEKLEMESGLEKHGCLGSSLGQWELIIFPPFTDRRPAWEDNNAYTLLGDRHRRCDVSECLYQRGREQAEEEG